MQKEVKIGDKTFVVRELLAKELDDVEINWDDVKEARKKQLMLATSLTAEQYDNLTMKERLKIQQVFNELNIEDFQYPTK